MRDDKTPPSFKDFDDRFGKLRKDDAATSREEAEAERSRSGVGLGLQIGIEIVGGVVGGVLIDLGLDWLFGTRPLMLIVLFVMGAAAGMLNAHRQMKRLMAATEDDDGD